MSSINLESTPQEQPNNTTDLSIIIVSYNTRHITIDCINSILKSLSKPSFAYEIIVFDNNSTDGSVEALQTLTQTIPHIKLIKSNENVGFGRGNNLAIQQAKGAYVLLLNSDTLVLDNAIDQLLTFYIQNQKQMHFIGAKLFNKDGSPQSSAAPFFNPFVVFAFLFLKGDKWGLTRSSPDNIKQVGWVSGACIMTKKEYFEKVGGFDEGIFMYMEEVDLLYRAKKLNYYTYFYPEAHFIHLGSASSNKTYPILQVYRGFLYFYRKHYPPFFTFLLKIMLQLKALLSLFIGKLTKNKYLIQTYGQAYQIASMD
jgi:N-acetylglucosaminyl-diphospho-decaprenol L-rhamnosyltransferase